MAGITEICFGEDGHELVILTERGLSGYALREETPFKKHFEYFRPKIVTFGFIGGSKDLITVTETSSGVRIDHLNRAITIEIINSTISTCEGRKISANLDHFVLLEFDGFDFFCTKSFELISRFKRHNVCMDLLTLFPSANYKHHIACIGDEDTTIHLIKAKRENEKNVIEKTELKLWTAIKALCINTAGTKFAVLDKKTRKLFVCSVNGDNNRELIREFEDPIAKISFQSENCLSCITEKNDLELFDISETDPNESWLDKAFTYASYLFSANGAHQRGSYGTCLINSKYLKTSCSVNRQGDGQFIYLCSNDGYYRIFKWNINLLTKSANLVRIDQLPDLD